MSVISVFLENVIAELESIGLSIAVISLIFWGFKILVSEDALERDRAKKIFLSTLIAIILIAASEKLVQELVALID